MKKNLSVLALILISGLLFSQVGINTENPKATLDVVGKPADITKIDGVIAPRLKGTELKTKDALYIGDQTGTIVYVTEALDGNTATSTTDDDVTTKTANVTSVGYYYFDGSLWQTLKPSEPWKVAASTNDATLNSQNIYQTGKVAIGRDPSLNSYYSTGLYPYLWVDATNDTGTGTAYGILNQLTSNKPGEKGGLMNIVTDNSTSGIGGITGLLSIVSDNSTVPRRAFGGNFTYTYSGSKNNSANDIFGLSNSVTFQSVGGPLSGKDIVGVRSNTLTNAVSGAITLQSLRGFDGTASLSSSGAQNITILNDITGGRFATHFNLFGGTASIPNAIGLNGAVTVSASTSGTYNITNAAGIQSEINLLSPTGSASKHITNLYGIQIKTPLASNATIINSYGLYIPNFRLTGDAATTAYNLYSEGTNTKNYFQGRVGVGITSPAAQLHIVKQAADLTPAIIVGCNEYADNAAAVAAGLPIGGIYRTGDTLKIVH